MFRWLFKLIQVRRALNDIEITVLGTFSQLEAASQNPMQIMRQFEMGAALAALIGALRDVYPNIPIENQSLAVALIEANHEKRINESEILCDTISSLINNCPDDKKLDTVFYIIAPKYTSNS